MEEEEEEEEEEGGGGFGGGSSSASNGGMLYHEVQESKLCAVHCVNTVLQGPFFSEFDLAALASDLDTKEHNLFMTNPSSSPSPHHHQDSHNVSMDGDFSIQVLQKALEVWDLQVIPYDCPVAEPAQIDPELENAFICHLQDHWFSIRKVNQEWYNFDSLYAAPEHLSKFYLSAYLDTLKGYGWSIFLVRGNFPKEFPISSSEAFNYGQWLLPEDAERITKSVNPTLTSPRQTNTSSNNTLPAFGDSDMEDEDLKAAIAASLLDSFPSMRNAESSTPVTKKPNAESSTPVTEKPNAEPSTPVTEKPNAESNTPVMEKPNAESSTPVTEKSNTKETSEDE